MSLPKDDAATLSARWTEGVLLKRDVFSTVERGRYQSDAGEVDAVGVQSQHGRRQGRPAQPVGRRPPGAAGCYPPPPPIRCPNSKREMARAQAECWGKV